MYWNVKYNNWLHQIDSSNSSHCIASKNERSKGYKSFDTTRHSTIEQTEIIKQITHNQICIVPYPAYREEQNSNMDRISNPNCTMRNIAPHNREKNAPQGNSNRHRVHANQHSGKRWSRRTALSQQTKNQQLQRIDVHPPFQMSKSQNIVRGLSKAAEHSSIHHSKCNHATYK